MTSEIETRLKDALTRPGFGVDPEPDFPRVVYLARRRRALRVAVCSLSLVVVGSVVGTAVVRSGGDAPVVRVGNSSDPAPDKLDAIVPPEDRLVLDHCTATYARETRATGAPVSVPVRPAEVFADTAQGVAGPLALLLRSSTPGGGSSTDGNTGGLRTNTDIGGRDATIQYWGTADMAGGANWDTADGGHAILYTRRLDAAELRAFVEELDRGGHDFPKGLTSIGMAEDATIAKTWCRDGDGMVASIEVVRGDTPSRFAHLLNASPGTVVDDGERTVIVVAFPGRYDPSDTAAHQATPEEWAALLKAGQNVEAPVGAPTVSVPHIDAVPIFLWVNASDGYAATDVGNAIQIPAPTPLRAAVPSEVAGFFRCDPALPVGTSRSHYALFEDPGWYRGTPAPPTFAAPPAPATPPECTPAVAAAAVRIQTFVDKYRWTDRIGDLEASPEIANARQQATDCLHARGIDSVSPDGFITDGWFQRHPDQTQQANLAFADCIAPVVAARDSVRSAARAAFIAEHRADVNELQAALEDYLAAIYDQH